MRVNVILFFTLLSLVWNASFVYAQDDFEGTSTTQTDQKISDQLEELEPYKSIAVIQKKFFPKTERWEVFLSGLGSLNNKMFTSLGAKVHLGYHFNERWALEGNIWYMGQITKGFTEDLEDRYQIRTSDIVTPQAFFGLNLVWSPVYGKLSLFEKTINPFELYFSLGGGMLITDDSQSVPAVHLAFGQIHPLSTQMAFRWEVGGDFYQAKGKEGLSAANSGKETFGEIIYVSLGVSFYFPEVEKR